MSVSLSQSNIGTLNSAIDWGFSNISSASALGLWSMPLTGLDAIANSNTEFAPREAADAFRLVVAAEGSMSSSNEDVSNLLMKLTSIATSDLIGRSARRFDLDGDFLARFKQRFRETRLKTEQDASIYGRARLRDYQEEACANTLASICAGKRGGLIVLPTGTGKTIEFVEIAKRVDEQGLLGNKKTLILVHRVELVDQAREKAERVFGKDKVSVVSAGRNSREFSGDVVVAGVQTLVSKKTLEMLNPEEYGLVIVDETHHIIANTWRKILHHLGMVDDHGHGIKASQKYLLGVTATPDRHDGVHISVMFPDGLLFSKPLTWFVLREYLMRPQGILVTTSAKLSQVPVTARGDYKEEELGQEMSRGNVLHEIVDGYEEVTPGEKALMFASSVGHAHVLAKAFNEKYGEGFAAAIDGTMKGDIREDVIARHKRGEIRVLTNYGVLTEGYDDPGIEAIWIARPTRSRSLYVQMVGRGLRPDPENPDRKMVKIVDVTGGIVEHDLDMDLAKLFDVVYATAGLPPMDVVEANLQFQKLLKDPKMRKELHDGHDYSDALEFLSVSLMRERTSPLAYTMFEKLSELYGGDVTAMSWDMGMTEDRLANYISGVMPGTEKVVRRDFARAPEILDIPLDEIVRLWLQSKKFGSVGAVLTAAQDMHKEYSNMSLRNFFSKLAGRWCANMFSDDHDLEDPPEMLRYKLWQWRQEGQNLKGVDAILDKHDSGVYRRPLAEEDVVALTELARAYPVTRDNIFDEARASGLALHMPKGMSFPDFVEHCHKKGLYMDELRRMINKWGRVPTTDKATIKKVFMSYIFTPEAERGTLEKFLGKFNIQPNRVPLVIRNFISSNAPVEEREKILEVARREGIGLPLPPFVKGFPDIDFIRMSPAGYLASRLSENRVEDPEFVARIYENDYTSYIRNMGRELRHRVIEDLYNEDIRRAIGEEELSPMSHPLAPLSNLIEGLANRWGSSVANIKGWIAMSPVLNDGQDGDISSTVKTAVLRRLNAIIDAVGKELRKSDNYYYEDMIRRLVEITGLSEADIIDWKVYSKKQAWSRSNMLSFPPKRPQSESDTWWDVGKKAWNSMSWKSWDMAKRKRMAKQAFENADVDFDKVLRAVASWNESTASMRDRAMIRKLFGKKAEGGAGFRKPK